MSDAIRLHPSWLDQLSGEFASPYMADLKRFLLGEREAGKRIFPRAANWFRALDLTPLDEVRVVILGQDPYHGEGQAHGLCFSVPGGVRPPPSLINIFKELQSDLGVRPSPHGFLEHWARQGVLLLNSVLTVEMGRAASHPDRGWERFTDAVIRIVNEKPEPVAFMLWGSYAQKKAAFVDQSRHLVLKAPHPSPLSAHGGFFGCRHFTQSLVAFALFVTAIIFGVATISNDNLQDLKTGQLVAATPWRQQLSLVLGVLFGSVVIPPILDLLNRSFGFVGAPGAGPDALAAPQAALISAIAQGVLGHNLDWGLIGLGAAIGVAAVIVDEVLRAQRKGWALPPLGVGMGIYLPVGVTALIVVGAVLGHLYNRWAEKQPNPGFAERMGVLTATGFIVGDSLFNVVYAGLVAGSDDVDVLAITEATGWQTPAGVLLFAAIIVLLYGWTRSQASQALSAADAPPPTQAAPR